MAYPVVGRCPICHEPLEVLDLHCRHCDAHISGHFSLSKFDSLTPEQLFFAETFIRCEGKINRVEEELGISYPTVRSRLAEVIEALGYKLDEETSLPPGERKEILQRLANGEIRADEAVSMLRGK